MLVIVGRGEVTERQRDRETEGQRDIDVEKGRNGEREREKKTESEIRKCNESTLHLVLHLLVNASATAGATTAAAAAAGSSQQQRPMVSEVDSEARESCVTERESRDDVTQEVALNKTTFDEFILALQSRSSGELPVLVLSAYCWNIWPSTVRSQRSSSLMTWYSDYHSSTDSIMRATDAVIGQKRALMCSHCDVGECCTFNLRDSGAPVFIADGDPICGDS